jgi:hypothetical protein
MSDAHTESVAAQAALAWLDSVGWRIAHGAEIASGKLAAERDDCAQVVLVKPWRTIAGEALAGVPVAELRKAWL